MWTTSLCRFIIIEQQSFRDAFVAPFQDVDHILKLLTLDEGGVLVICRISAFVYLRLHPSSCRSNPPLTSLLRYPIYVAFSLASWLWVQLQV